MFVRPIIARFMIAFTRNNSYAGVGATCDPQRRGVGEVLHSINSHAQLRQPLKIATSGDGAIRPGDHLLILQP
jgi:hypothetical protein